MVLLVVGGHHVDTTPRCRQITPPPNGSTGEDHRRLYENCGDISHVERETAYYAQHRRPAAG
jgi:hypothetical protein